VLDVPAETPLGTENCTEKTVPPSGIVTAVPLKENHAKVKVPLWGFQPAPLEMLEFTPVTVGDVITESFQVRVNCAPDRLSKLLTEIGTVTVPPAVVVSVPAENSTVGKVEACADAARRSDARSVAAARFAGRPVGRWAACHPRAVWRVSKLVSGRSLVLMRASWEHFTCHTQAILSRGCACNHLK
jgi:hypothetical protein